MKMDNEEDRQANKLCGLSIYAVDETPACIAEAAAWFSGKWSIALEAYIESMEQSLTSKSGVPRWYLARDCRGRIAGGVGVIENDFHKRTDLRPNICALYVEREFRGCGLARRLLERTCCELAAHDIHDAYLLTTHTDLYERMGWSFHCYTEEDSGKLCKVYRRSCRQ